MLISSIVTPIANFNPILLQNLQFLLDASAAGTIFFQDTGFTIPCTNNTTCKGILDSSGQGNNATQSTAGNAFTYLTNQINGQPALRPVGITSSYGQSTVTYTGVFTVYCVCHYNVLTDNLWVIGKASTTENGVGIVTFPAAEIAIAGNVQSNFPNLTTGNIAIRFRRDSSNNCWFASTGQSEILLGNQSGTMTVDTLFANIVISGYASTTSLISFVSAQAADTVTNGQNTNMLVFINSRFGLTIP